ncbi:hypothetical protein SARC_17387, partial [Sphaeroforma arctica JP610]
SRNNITRVDSKQKFQNSISAGKVSNFGRLGASDLAMAIQNIQTSRPNSPRNPEIMGSRSTIGFAWQK